MAFKLKNRFYKHSYIERGFTAIREKLPQCVVCFKVLSSQSTKPSLLKRHFSTNYPEVSVEF